MNGVITEVVKAGIHDVYLVTPPDPDGRVYFIVITSFIYFGQFRDVSMIKFELFSLFSLESVLIYILTACVEARGTAWTWVEFLWTMYTRLTGDYLNRWVGRSTPLSTTLS